MVLMAGRVFIIIASIWFPGKQIKKEQLQNLAWQWSPQGPHVLGAREALWINDAIPSFIQTDTYSWFLSLLYSYAWNVTYSIFFFNYFSHNSLPRKRNNFFNYFPHNPLPLHLSPPWEKPVWCSKNKRWNQNNFLKFLLEPVEC